VTWGVAGEAVRVRTFAEEWSGLRLARVCIALSAECEREAERLYQLEARKEDGITFPAIEWLDALTLEYFNQARRAAPLGGTETDNRWWGRVGVRDWCTCGGSVPSVVVCRVCQGAVKR
jgi:hypothetical protein